MGDPRLERNVRFFGELGQERIRSTTITIAGAGGLGCFVAQELALLGVSKLYIIDSEELAVTDRNRSVCASSSDPIPGSRKVDLCGRMIRAIDPAIRVKVVHDSVISQQAFGVILSSDWVFGCLDSEGTRFVLNELCSAYAIPFVDVATDIPPGERVRYGGRVCFATGLGCLVCLDQIDMNEARDELGGAELKELGEQLYGVEKAVLGTSGPSVVSINGLVASLAVTEFAVAVAGLRPPNRVLTYHGHLGRVSTSSDDPHPDCYYCHGIRGVKAAADVQRYVREGIGKFLR
jgi:hypothetical protein